MQTALDSLCLEISLLKDLLIRQKGNGRSGIRLAAGPVLLQVIADLSPFKPLIVDDPVLADVHLQPLGERIYHGCADAVQSAGDLVIAIPELAAGMEHGKYHFHGRSSGLGMDPDRDTASVVPDRHRSVRVQRHLDLGTVSRQMLIHRIIHDLIDQVVQALG